MLLHYSVCVLTPSFTWPNSFYFIVTQFGVITPYSINILDSVETKHFIESFTDCPGAVAFSIIKRFRMKSVIIEDVLPADLKNFGLLADGTLRP